MIKVPPGVTEIDLRPVLAPIVIGIIEHTRIRDGHPGASYKTPSTTDVQEWLDGAATQLYATKLAELVTRDDLVTALERRGWEREDKTHDHRWHKFRHSYVTLPSELSLTNKTDIVHRVAHADCVKDIPALLREILGCRTILDEIVWTIEEST